MTPIERLRAIADQLTLDGPLRHALDADVEAVRGGMKVVVCAARETQTSEVKQALSRAAELAVLSEYRSVSAWEEEHLASVARARVLVCVTEARQIMPATLLALFESTNATRTPIVWLIAGLKRVARPDGVKPRAEREALSVLTHDRWHVWCLGDERYEGPELDAALAEAFESSLLAEPASVRVRDLATWRRRALTDAAMARSRAVERRASAITMTGRLLLETRDGMRTLGRATATTIEEALSTAAEALSQIGADELVDAVLTRAGSDSCPHRDEPLSVQFARALREAIGMRLATAMEAERDRARTAASDLTRAIAFELRALGEHAGLEALPPPGDAPAPDLRVEALSAQLIEEAKRAVRVSEPVVDYLDRLAAGRPEPVAEPEPEPDDGWNVEGPNEERGGESPENAEDGEKAVTGPVQPADPDEPTRRAWMDIARDRVARSRFASTAERALLEAASTFRMTLDAERGALNEAIERHVDAQFRATQDAVRETKRSVEAERDRVCAALAALRED